MNIDAIEAAVSRRIVGGTAKVLTLDIETSPDALFNFGLKVPGGYINAGNVIEPGAILCWAAKWYDRKGIEFGSDFHDGHDAQIARIRELVDQADIIVGYNHRAFDMRWLRQEWWLAGLEPPRPWKDVDLLLAIRRLFRFPSNKLDYISQQVGIGEKVKHEGMSLWVACMNGDAKAWARMKKYNIGDVALTEKLYDRLRPWLHNHPHMARAAEPVCNRCGSTDLERQPQDYLAVLITYALYRCKSCGGMVRGGDHHRVATTRGVQ